MPDCVLVQNGLVLVDYCRIVLAGYALRAVERLIINKNTCPPAKHQVTGLQPCPIMTLM